MSVKHGNDGIVKIGANVVGEVQEFNYDEEDVAPSEITSMGDTEATPLASGCKRGKGTVTCLLDEADSDGQNAFFGIGDTITLNLYPEGDQSGDMEYSGSVVVRTVPRVVNKAEPNKISFSFDGVLTRAAVV